VYIFVISCVHCLSNPNPNPGLQSQKGKEYSKTTTQLVGDILLNFVLQNTTVRQR